MRTGVIEANLLRLNEPVKLPYIQDLVARKTEGPEKGTLDSADLTFHQKEYERLRQVLQDSFEQSHLPEIPNGAAALNDLLVRLRLRSVPV